MTRSSGSSSGHELLVFQHPDAGIQLPAGTVEPGEAFETAALREVEEETGLSNSRLISKLGSDITPLDSVKAVFEETALMTGPSSEAERLALLPRGYWCRINGEQDEYSEVLYEEFNYNVDPPRVIVRYGGWVRSSTLAHRMERHFFHVEATGATQDRWVQRAEDRFDFECYWVPIVPKPDIQSPQQEWIDAHYEALIASIR